MKYLRVLTAPHCGNQLLCSSANVSYPSAGQWEGDSPSWFGVSASGDGYKLQMSLLKHLNLRQGEDIETARMRLRTVERHSQVWTSGGEKPSLRLVHGCLGLLVAQSGPRQPFPVCPWKSPLQGLLLEAVMKLLV